MFLCAWLPPDVADRPGVHRRRGSSGAVVDVARAAAGSVRPGCRRRRRPPSRRSRSACASAARRSYSVCACSPAPLAQVWPSPTWIGTRPRRSGSAKVVWPLPPYVVPSSEKSAWFWLIGQQLAVAQRPALRREVERQDPDLRQERLSHSSPLARLWTCGPEPVKVPGEFAQPRCPACPRRSCCGKVARPRRRSRRPRSLAGGGWCSCLPRAGSRCGGRVARPDDRVRAEVDAGLRTCRRPRRRCRRGCPGSSVMFGFVPGFETMLPEMFRLNWPVSAMPPPATNCMPLELYWRIVVVRDR